MNRGFTIIELLVSIAIFVVMTSVVVAKFGNFNNSTLLTDTAYDIALVVRLAQSYGLSVKNADPMDSSSFLNPFGVDFNKSNSADCGTAQVNENYIVLFADSDPIGTPNHVCSDLDADMDSYKIIRGARISDLCAGASSVSCTPIDRVTISYERPNPEAIICTNGSAAECTHTYAEITIQGADGGERTVVVYQNGQVSVAN